MEHNFEICKKLSKEVYQDNVPAYVDGWKAVLTLGEKYVAQRGGTVSVNKDMNFACAAYINEDIKELIIAFRGTNDKMDIITDLSFVFENVPFVTSKFARKFYDQVKKKYPEYKFYLTGHSLGGAYAQLLCAQLVKEQDICRAITFNPPGMAYVLDDKNATKALKYPNISNYVVMNDFIGNFRAHIGNIYCIPPIPFDKIGSDGKPLTPHGGILLYEENIYGKCCTKPIGFGAREAWALYSYDIKNTEPYRFITKRKVRPIDLKNAVEIIEKAQDVQIFNKFDYRTNSESIVLEIKQIHA